MIANSMVIDEFIGNCIATFMYLYVIVFVITTCLVMNSIIKIRKRVSNIYQLMQLTFLVAFSPIIYMYVLIDYISNEVESELELQMLTLKDV